MQHIEKPKDKWARIIFIPLMGLLVTLLFDKREYATNNGIVVINIVVSIFSTFILWQGNRYIVILLRSKFADYNDVLQRIVWQLIASTIFSLCASNLIYFTLMYMFPQFPLCNEDRVFMSQLSLILTFLVISIYEGTYYFGKWKEALVHGEELKRQQISAQFESLKSQVNPHFLFNSLNTLTALIEENPDLAVRFVAQLSLVYRYVLQSKDKETVELKTELEFTESYIFLLRYRFENNLKVNIQLEEKYLRKSLAPLALQMLIENAIKHNVVSADKPLLIDIYIENEQFVVVKNTLQRKNNFEQNNGLGLPNILKRYSYLSQIEPRIEQTETYFKVLLPLL